MRAQLSGVVARVATALGWHSTEPDALDLLTHLLQRRLLSLASATIQRALVGFFLFFFLLLFCLFFLAFPFFSLFSPFSFPSAAHLIVY